MGSAEGWLGVEGLEVRGLGVGGLGFGGLGVGVLGVGVLTVDKLPPPWPVAGDGAPRREIFEEAIAFQRFLERAVEVDLWAPDWPWMRHPTGE